MKPSWGSQRGLSLVELMVGITVGLIVAAGASMVAVNQINEHRRLTLETQIQQDLRVAADLIQQDLRRAGFRGNPENGVWAPATNVGTLKQSEAVAATANVYAGITVPTDDNLTDRVVSYSYAKKDVDGNFNTGSEPLSNEHFGVRWGRSAQALYLMLGKKDGQPNWQPITDPDSVKIVDFSVELSSQDVYLVDFCDRPCDKDVVGNTCPKQQVREIKFSIRGQATHDSKVVRTLSGVERVRADSLTGACPT